MRVFRKLSVKKWTRILASALDDACEKAFERNPSRYIKRLNQQHHRIRSWDLGAPAINTAWAGWRLLPGTAAPAAKRTRRKRD